MSIGAFVAVNTLMQSTLSNNNNMLMNQMEMARSREADMHNDSNHYSGMDNIKNYNNSALKLDKKQLMHDLKHYIPFYDIEKIESDIYNDVYSKENILKAARKIGAEINEPQLYDSVFKYLNNTSSYINHNIWYLFAMASIKKTEASCTFKTEYAYGISFMIMEVFTADTSKLQQLILANDNLSRINKLKHNRDGYVYYCYTCVDYILSTICGCAED